MPDGNQGGAVVGPGTPNQGGAVVGPAPSPSEGGAVVGLTPTDTATAVSTANEVTVSILGGLISPSSVIEKRPGVAGDGASALTLRRLARAEKRIAALESAQ